MNNEVKVKVEYSQLQKYKHTLAESPFVIAMSSSHISVLTVLSFSFFSFPILMFPRRLN